MEEILKAYKEYQEAYRKVWDRGNPKAGRWDSQERKDLDKAEDNFTAAVRDSEYSEVFERYADIQYRE